MIPTSCDLQLIGLQYGAYHRDPTNVAIHIACVPVLLATGFVFVRLLYLNISRCI